MNKRANPRCPDCSSKLILTRIGLNWKCEACNAMFLYKDRYSLGKRLN